MQLIPIEDTGATLAPTEDASEVVTQIIEATIALYTRRGYKQPWIGYLAVEGNRIVGSCGFAGPPSEGEVEIAYFTFPGCEGRGVATQMAQELLSVCRPEAREAGVQFIAHTLPTEGPSTSILRKLGFRNAGVIQHSEDGAVWKWVENTRSEA
jgi:RimJ/RimL family protein N-acetyltransferase